MVSKNNQQWKQQQEAQAVPHYGLRKLSIGVASVLLSTTLYMGVNAHVAHADTAVSPSETVASSTGMTSNSSLPSTEMTGNATSSGDNLTPAKPVSQAGQPSQSAKPVSQAGQPSRTAKPDSQLSVTLGE